MTKDNRVLAAMMAAMFLSYLPWYSFSAVASVMARDLELTISQMGVILAVFQAGYVIMVIGVGFLSDRFGHWRVLAAATIFTALAAILTPFLTVGFYSLLFFRLTTGLGAGAIYVPGLAYLSGWFAPASRGRAFGAYTAALTASYAGGYFVAAPLAAAVNWQAGLLATALPAAAAGLILIFFVPRQTPAEPNAPADAAKSEVRTKPEMDAPVLLTTGYAGHMWELYAFWGWIGPFLAACFYAKGFSQTEAMARSGFWSSMIILSGVASVWAVGWLSDRLGRLKTIILSATLSLLAEFILGFTYGTSLALVLAVGFFIGFWSVADSGVYKAALVESVPGSMKSTALGFQSAFGFLATIISPLVFGFILTASNPGLNNSTEAEVWTWSFAALGLGALLAPLSIAGLKRRQSRRAGPTSGQPTL